MNYVLLFGMPGGGELFFIILIVVMLFGSKKIPELARGLGKGMREIKNATEDIQREIKEGTKDIKSMKETVDVKKQVKDLLKGDKEKKESITRADQAESDSRTIKRGSSYTKEEPHSSTDNN